MTTYEVVVSPDDGQPPAAVRVGFPFTLLFGALNLFRRLTTPYRMRKIMPLDPPRAWFVSLVEVTDGKRTQIEYRGIDNPKP